MSATATIPDLWPADFGTDTEPSPASILRQQGYKLGERTEQVVYGEVESEASSKGTFKHTLVLSAPFLKIRQHILTVEHKLDPYPATVSAASLGRSEVTNSAELATQLRRVFASPQLVALVRSLLAQARDLDEGE